jgi:hypothetical protein
MNRVASRVKEVWGAFYSPPREFARWGVRDPNMFRLGARHVSQNSLEPGLGTGQVRFRALTQDKVERAEMSGSGVKHVRPTSL